VTTRFRIIDTGIREGRANIAFDQAMIELHGQGAIPDTIRFLRFPPTALIGRHQVLRHEVCVDHCRRNHVGIARRITGGGAIYFDQGQLGWALVFHRASLGIASLEMLAREICEAAAAGLSRLGVEARYRPRNDIEVDGRKISGTGGFFDGDTLFYQGTVLVDMNPADMVAALRVPAAALLDGFAERLGITPYSGAVGPEEDSTAERILDEEVGTEEFVGEIDDPATGADVYVGTHTGTGGTITSYLRLEGKRQDRIREVLLTGDFFVTPPRVTLDLEAALRGVTLGEVESTIRTFFETTEIGSLSVEPGDFVAAINAALEPVESQ